MPPHLTDPEAVSSRLRKGSSWTESIAGKFVPDFDQCHKDIPTFEDTLLGRLDALREGQQRMESMLRDIRIASHPMRKVGPGLTKSSMFPDASAPRRQRTLDFTMPDEEGDSTRQQDQLPKQLPTRKRRGSTHSSASLSMFEEPWDAKASFANAHKKAGAGGSSASLSMFEEPWDAKASFANAHKKAHSTPAEEGPSPTPLTTGRPEEGDELGDEQYEGDDDARAINETRTDNCRDLLFIKGWAKSNRVCSKQSATSASASDLTARPGWQRKILRSAWFDNTILLLIVINAVILGVQVHIMACEKMSSAPKVYNTIQTVLGFVFLAELLFRMYVLRRRFFTGHDNKWNIFDLVVVVGTLVEFVIEVSSNGQANGSQAMVLRVFRLMRVVRLAKTVRVIRFLRELRVMVFSILSSMRPLLWAILLLLVVLFAVGVYLTQVVTQYRIEFDAHPERAPSDSNVRALNYFFKDLFHTMYFLLQCVSGGISWGEVSDPLLELSWWYAIVMSFFTCFTFLALLNIITGVFVDGAIRKAQSDKEARIDEELEEEAAKMRTLQECFTALDADGNGTIDLEEFEDFMSKPRAKAEFRTMGLPISKAYHLFRMLDIDNSGTVNISEFVMGCMRMIGGANNLDLATLMYENKRMMSRIKEFFEIMEGHFQHLYGILGPGSQVQTREDGVHLALADSVPQESRI